MLPVAPAERADLERRVDDIDDQCQDGLMPINEKLIRQVERKLAAGEQVDTTTIRKQKIGNYKNDIIASILEHNYFSQENAFEVLKIFFDCAHDFVDILRKKSKQCMVEIVNSFLHGKGNLNRQIERQEAHMLFVLNMKNTGFDEDGALLFGTIALFQGGVAQLSKQVELSVQGGFSVARFKERFTFNLAEYFKSVYVILQYLQGGMFVGYDGYSPLICEMTAAQVLEANRTGKLSISVPAGVASFCSHYFSSNAKMAMQVYQAFQQLINSVRQQRVAMRKANVQELEEYKSVVKMVGYISMQINMVLEYIGFPKELQAIQVLSPIEEMQMTGYIHQKYTDMCRVYSFRPYEEVVGAGQAEEILYCCNACHVEMRFAYPAADFLKFQVEQLKELQIEDVLVRHKEISFAKYFDKYMARCRNLDDVEYLAYTIYHQIRGNVDELNQFVGEHLLQPWNGKRVRFMAHFIACFYYNGVRLNYLQPDGQLKDLCLHCVTVKSPHPAQIDGLCELLSYLLKYRLVSSRNIYNIVRYSLLQVTRKKSGEHLVLYARYGSTLLSYVMDVINIIDDSFYSSISKLDEMAALKKMVHDGVFNKSEVMYAEQLLSSLNMLANAYEQSQKVRENIREELVAKERAQKREDFLKRLRKQNFKLYQQEMAKAKREAEDAEKRLREEEQRKARKQAEAQKAKGLQLQDIIGHLDALVVKRINGDEQFQWRVKDFIGQLGKYVESASNSEKNMQKKMNEKQNSGSPAMINMDEIKDGIRLKMLEAIMDHIQDNLSLASVDVYAEIYKLMGTDLYLSHILSKIRYCSMIMENKVITKNVCIAKYMLFRAWLLADDGERRALSGTKQNVISAEQMKQVTRSLLGSIVFTRVQSAFADMSVNHQQLIELLHISVADSCDTVLQWKAQYLLQFAQDLDDNAITAAAIIVYCQLDERQQYCAEGYQQLINKYSIGDDAIRFVSDNYDARLLNIVENKTKRITVVPDDPEIECLMDL